MTVDLTIKMTDQRLSHVWRTTIQHPLPGIIEKRSALNTWPRVNLENKIQMSTDNERAFMHYNFLEKIFDFWYIPIISDKILLTSQAASGQKILAIDETDYRHFYDGRQLVLIDPDDWESYEVVDIDTVDSGVQITSENNLSATWPAGTKVYPYYKSRIEDKQNLDSKFPGIENVEILSEEEFESIRSFDYTLPTIDASVYPVYNSLNLFLNSPRAPIKENYRFPFVISGSIGLKTPFSTYDHTRMIFDREFQLTSKKDIYDLLDFFDAKQGRLGTFYTPTWLNDIVIADGFDSGDTVLTTNKIYIPEPDLTGNHVLVRFPDNSYAAREIVDRPSETSIEIDSTIGTTIPTASLSRVKTSFLYETRFNQDEISIDYVFKENLAKINLAFNIL